MRRADDLAIRPIFLVLLYYLTLGLTAEQGCRVNFVVIQMHIGSIVGTDPANHLVKDKGPLALDSNLYYLLVLNAEFFGILGS